MGDKSKAGDGAQLEAARRAAAEIAAAARRAAEKFAAELRAAEAKRAAETRRKTEAAAKAKHAELEKSHHDSHAGKPQSINLFDANTWVGKKVAQEIQAVKNEINTVKHAVVGDVKSLIHSANKEMVEHQSPSDNKKPGEHTTQPGQINKPDSGLGTGADSDKVKLKGSEKHPQGENPEKLTPKQRAEKGWTSYEDPKTHMKYHYNQSGQISEMESKGGFHTQIQYKPNSNDVDKFECRNKAGAQRASGPLDVQTSLKIDQKTGEIAASKKFDTPQQSANQLPESRTDTRFNPDGTIAVIHLDAKGRHVSKEICVQGKNGPETVSRINFNYYDSNGQKTLDPDKIDEKQPVVASQCDKHGRLTDHYQFKNTKDASHQKASSHEHIQYAENKSSHTITEQHSRYDLTKANHSTPYETTNKIYNTTTGCTTVDTTGINGSHTHIKFDKDARTTEYTREENHHKFSFALQDGKVAGVSQDGHMLKGDIATKLALIASQDLVKTTKEYQVEAYKPSMGLQHLTSTAPREGKEPNGTLVYNDSTGNVSQYKVEKGQIKNASNQVVGTVQDNGDFTLNGQKHNILDGSESTAFHGVGSDGSRLDLADKKDAQSGFNGVFKSPDGGHTLLAMGGNLYDEQGKFKGHLDEGGKVHLPDHQYSQSGTDVNSEFNNWTFKGLEAGKPREFVANKEISNGKMFIPDPKTHAPTEYEVRMGMLINKQTNEQFGRVAAPHQGANGQLEGGCIYPPNDGQPIPLQNFTKATFDLQVMGDSTGNTDHDHRTSRIQGVCLGPDVDAAGRPIPGKGGYFNVAQSKVDQKTRREQLATEVEQQGIVSRISETTTAIWGDKTLEQRNENLKTQSESADFQLDRMITKGQVDDATLASLSKSTSDTQTANLGGPLEAQRKQLNTLPPKLEELPKDPSKLQGYAIVPHIQGNGESAQQVQTKYIIKEGKIYSPDGKVQVGSIDGPDGKITWANPSNQLPMNISMKDLKGVWHLEYPDGKGAQQKVDWVSTGGDIISLNDCKRRASLETQYAQAVNDKHPTEQSKIDLARGQELEKRFKERLDNIAGKGIASEDMKFLLEGPTKHARAEGLREEVKVPPPKIELPAIDEKNVNTVNGRLRYGNQVYQIINGELHKRTGSGDKEYVKDPGGKLVAGYSIQLDGQQPIQLANENRVLMQFTIGSDKQQHNVMGIGPDRVLSNGERVSGGLVTPEELDRQAKKAQDDLANNNGEYFKSRPWLMERTQISAMVLGRDEGMLHNYSNQLSEERLHLKQELSRAFTDGFDTKKFDNNRLDGYSAVTQRLMGDIGATGSDGAALGQQLKQQHQELNDAVVMAAMTVATAGIGSVAGAAFNGARIALWTERGLASARMLRVGASAAEFVADGTAGALISGVGRQSQGGDLNEFSRNAYAGFLEGGLAMGGGAIAGKQSQLAFKALSDAGNVSKGAMLTMKGIYNAGDAFLQTTAFNTAAAWRDGNSDIIQKLGFDELGMGTFWMMAGKGLAGGFKTSAGHALGHSAERECCVLRALARNIPKDGVAVTAMHDMMMAYSNAGLSAMPEAYKQQREEIAARLHISVDSVSAEMLLQEGNFGRILDKMNEAGLKAAASAPLMTLGSHHVTERLNRILSPESSHVQMDKYGNVEKVKFEGGAEAKTFDFGYDKSGTGEHFLNSMKGGNGETWTSKDGKTYEITKPDGRQTTFNGKVEVTVDGGIRKTSAKGTRTEHLDGSVSFKDTAGNTRTADRSGRIVSHADAEWHEHQYRYNEKTGKLDSITFPDGRVASRVNEHEWKVGQPGPNRERVPAYFDVNPDGSLKIVSEHDLGRPKTQSDLHKKEWAAEAPVYITKADGEQAVASAHQELLRTQQKGEQADIARAQANLDLVEAKSNSDVQRFRAIADLEMVEVKGEHDLAKVEREWQVDLANAHQALANAEGLAKHEPANAAAQEALLKARENVANTESQHSIAKAEAEGRLIQSRVETEGNNLVAQARMDGPLDIANKQAKLAAAQAAAQQDPAQNAAVVEARETLSKANAAAEHPVFAAQEVQLVNNAQAKVETAGKVAIAQAEAAGKAAVAKQDALLKLAQWKAEQNPSDSQLHLNKVAAEGNVSIARAELEHKVAVATAQGEHNATVVREQNNLQLAGNQSEHLRLAHNANISLAEAQLAFAQAQADARLAFTKFQVVQAFEREHAKTDKKVAASEHLTSTESDALMQARQQLRDAQDRMSLAMRQEIERRRVSASLTTGSTESRETAQPRPSSSVNQARDNTRLGDIQALPARQANQRGWIANAVGEFNSLGSSLRKTGDNTWQLTTAGKMTTIRGDVEQIGHGILRFTDRETGTVRLQHPDGRATITGQDGWRLRLGPDGSIMKIIDVNGRAHIVQTDARGNIPPQEIGMGIFLHEGGSLTVANNKGEMLVRGPDGRMLLARTPQEFFQKLMGDHISRVQEEFSAQKKVKSDKEIQRVRLLLEQLNNFRSKAPPLSSKDTSLAVQLHATLSGPLEHCIDLIKDSNPRSEEDFNKAQTALRQAMEFVEELTRRTSTHAGDMPAGGGSQPGRGSQVGLDPALDSEKSTGELSDAPEHVMVGGENVQEERTAPATPMGLRESLKELPTQDEQLANVEAIRKQIEGTLAEARLPDETVPKIQPALSSDVGSIPSERPRQVIIHESDKPSAQVKIQLSKLKRDLGINVLTLKVAQRELLKADLENSRIHATRHGSDIYIFDGNMRLKLARSLKIPDSEIVVFVGDDFKQRTTLAELLKPESQYNQANRVEQQGQSPEELLQPGAPAIAKSEDVLGETHRFAEQGEVPTNDVAVISPEAAGPEIFKAVQHWKEELSAAPHAVSEARPQEARREPSDAGKPSGIDVGRHAIERSLNAKVAEVRKAIADGTAMFSHTIREGLATLAGAGREALEHFKSSSVGVASGKDATYASSPREFPREKPAFYTEKGLVDSPGEVVYESGSDAVFLSSEAVREMAAPKANFKNGDTGDKQLFRPKRDLADFTPAERAEALRYAPAELCEPHGRGAFIDLLSERTSRWTDVRQEHPEVEQSAVRLFDELVKVRQALVESNMVSEQDLHKAEVVRQKCLSIEGGEQLLRMYESGYLHYRQQYAEQLKSVENVIKVRGAELEAQFKTRAAKLGLPEFQVKIYHDLGANGAAYKDGVLMLPAELVLDAHRASEIVESFEHELTHIWQDKLIISNLADKLGITGAAATPRQLERLQQLYSKYARPDGQTGQLPTNFVEAILKLRDGKALSFEHEDLANRLAVSFKNNKPITKEFTLAGNHFRLTDRELKKLDAGKPASELLEQLAADKGTLSGHLFGGEQPPLAVRSLIESWQRAKTGEGAPFDNDKAAAELAFILRHRLVEINDSRAQAYEQYMSVLHEKQAFIVGALVHEQAVQHGASAKDESGPLPAFLRAYDLAAYARADLSMDMVDASISRQRKANVGGTPEFAESVHGTTEQPHELIGFLATEPIVIERQAPEKMWQIPDWNALCSADRKLLERCANNIRLIQNGTLFKVGEQLSKLPSFQGLTDVVQEIDVKYHERLKLRQELGDDHPDVLAAHQQYIEYLKQIRNAEQQIEDILRSCDKDNLLPTPRVRIVYNNEKDQDFSADYNYGEIRVNASSLAEAPPRLQAIQTIAHAFTHHEQRELSKAKSAITDPVQSERAEVLAEIQDHQPHGELENLRHRYELAAKNYNDLQKSRRPDLLIEELAKQPDDSKLKQVFGEDVSGEISELVDNYGTDSGLVNSMSPKAFELLSRALMDSLQQINDQRQSIWQNYMQYHEREAWAAGALVRKHVEEFLRSKSDATAHSADLVEATSERASEAANAPVELDRSVVENVREEHEEMRATGERKAAVVQNWLKNWGGEQYPFMQVYDTKSVATEAAYSRLHSPKDAEIIEGGDFSAERAGNDQLSTLQESTSSRANDAFEQPSPAALIADIPIDVQEHLRGIGTRLQEIDGKHGWTGPEDLEVLLTMYKSGVADLRAVAGQTPSEFAECVADFVEEVCSRWTDSADQDTLAEQSDSQQYQLKDGRGAPAAVDIGLRSASERNVSFEGIFMECLMSMPPYARDIALKPLERHNLIEYLGKVQAVLEDYDRTSDRRPPVELDRSDLPKN